MAKASTSKGSSTKIRFIMIEAEIAEGDLSQISQAIQNALKPALPPARQSRLAQQTNSSADDVELEELVEESADSDDTETAPTSKPAKQHRQRTISVPKVLELELSGDPTWADFAIQKAPKSEREKFLTVAAWFKLHKQIDAITTDHVYTCYRAAKWSTSLDDFNAPLRALKHAQLLSTPTRGLYAINHLGLSRVDELPGS